MRKSPLATFAILFVCLLSTAAIKLGKDPFEGIWTVTITPDEDSRQAHQKDMKDKLKFHGIQLTSEAWAKKGFDPGVYEEDTRPGAIGQFTCEMKSKDNGKLKWTGMVAADELKGEIVWTDKDGNKLNFTYVGTK